MNPSGTISSDPKRKRKKGDTIYFQKERSNIGTEKHAQNVFHFFEELKNIENRVAWFLAELSKTEKGAKDK
jgi:hypothetical protein